METKIGKIQSIEFGFGGYDDAMVGLSVTLGGPGWGVCDFKGTWSHRSEGAKWSLQDQRDQFGDTVLFIRDLLRDAKKQTVETLRDVPVEAMFDNDRRLKSWRVLTEVI